MKKTSKLISIVLAVIMAISVIPFTALAGAIPSSVKTVDALISNNSLVTVVDWLVEKLNTNQTSLLGAVLPIVFSAIKDADDPANNYFALSTIVGDKDITALTDEQSATILVEWLNKNLPGWTSGIDQATINQYTTLLGITLNLSSVDGVLNTLRELDSTAAKIALPSCGDARDIDVSAFTGVTTDGGNFNVLCSFIQFISDNIGIINKVIMGTLELGAIENFYDPDASDNGINTIMKNLPATLKELIYGLVANTDANGNQIDFATSVYSNYTADQLLAVAFKQLISGSDAVVSTTDANAITNMSIYATLAEYADDIYANFAIEPLNNGLKTLITSAANYSEDVKNQFNLNYTFTTETFAAAFADAKTTGVLGQLNNFLVTILKTVTSDAALNALNLEEGGNEKLNSNLTKLCKYVLPILAAIDPADLGADLSSFTAATVANMSLEEMAVGVLKLFYGTWFSSNAKYNAAHVDSATTLEQLSVLALYYTVSNTNLIHLTGVDAQLADFDNRIMNINNLNDKEESLDFILDMAATLAFGALQYNSDTTYFVVTANTSSWGYAEMYDEIIDWALSFVSGMPAVVKSHITGISACARGTYDPCYGDPYYKLNVILNELVDFSFLTGANDATFKLDLGALFENVLADNLFDFDLVGVLDTFKVNQNSTNILNATIITGAISLVDRIVTALFEHNCDGTATATNTVRTCTRETSTIYTYCKNNGAYTAAPRVTTSTISNHTLDAGVVITPSKCGVAGVRRYTCSTCGETINESYTVDHNWSRVQSPATCGEAGKVTLTCNDCNTVRVNVNPNAPATGNHTFDAGTCTVCGTADPTYLAYVLGDIDLGGISSSDARLALRYSVGLEEFTETQKLAADVTGDGEIKADDARAILRVSVKLDSIVDGVYIPA